MAEFLLVVERLMADGADAAMVVSEDQARCSLTLTAQTVKFLGAGKGGQDVEAHAD